MSSNKQTIRRYVAGRVPHYAGNASSDEEEVEQFTTKDIDIDRKLTLEKAPVNKVRGPNRTVESEEDEEDEVEHRHAAILQRRRAQEETELLANEDSDDEMKDDDDEDDSEDEDDSDEEDDDEYTDDEDDTGPQLKPVFVPKKHREQKIEVNIESTKEIEKKSRDERRKEALRIIEEETKRELLDSEKKEEEQLNEDMLACNDEDDDEELEYESWKVRELKRIKRTKEESEAEMKEKAEIERLRSLTEEERLEELKKRPKIITNKAAKGKYKYLQKYYHRGAFYMDQEETILKRNYAEPTLEDQFDKTILPKIMQVKNFGRSGRTKYTHLVDQDTTAFDSPWATENAQTSKFHNTAGGMKQCFDRPTKKRK
ncbi:microfibrillar-associated protein 1A [Tetranychus urticae]|uniref:Micro-fibrillar-associated protein 1 C-terminal domain-containing protein n=1 Tax=Tetranychus urticae TaxID=32264 RepID=T1KSB0_TETUR|nr:microfibrillar-associated protein 1A [Tetranychus urticae]